MTHFTANPPSTPTDNGDIALPVMQAKVPFHVMTKPIGPICNLDCSYCFYLEKEDLWEGKSNFRMDEDQLERYIKQYIEGQPANTPEIVFAFQGGEPTLMGVKFFEKVMELEKKYARPGVPVTNALQTNATLLDDEWGKFLKDNNFLVGVSVDGPEKIHDLHRYDKQGGGSFKDVMRGIEVLQKHEVDFNTLTVVQADNGNFPAEIYDFLRSIGSTFFQFIPIVEHDQVLEAKKIQRPILPIIQPDGKKIGVRSVQPKQWGDFLNTVFDRWIEREDVGRIFVQHFDLMLGMVYGYPSSLCVHSETCGNAMDLEHDGGLYACDHYVSPEYYLGNIKDKTIAEMTESDQQRKFGNDKRDTLPEYCKKCDYLKYCWGACPKDRILKTPDGEDGLAYLCEGYMAFYKHTIPTFEKMAAVLRMGRPASDYKYLDQIQAQQHRQMMAPPPRTQPRQKIGRNDPCPCGSGKKYKQCCGKKG